MEDLIKLDKKTPQHEKRDMKDSWWSTHCLEPLRPKDKSNKVRTNKFNRFDAITRFTVEGTQFFFFFFNKEPNQFTYVFLYIGRDVGAVGNLTNSRFINNISIQCIYFGLLLVSIKTKNFLVSTSSRTSTWR